METGFAVLDQAYQILLVACLIVLAVMVVLCLIRAIIGPKVADRVVASNMIGTMVIVIIAILAIMQEESYLVDVCLIYAMISFLAVIILTKVYTGMYRQRREEKKKEENHDRA